MKRELEAILPNLQGVRLFVKEEDDPKPEVCATPRRELDPTEPSVTLFFRGQGHILWVNLKQENPFNKIAFIRNGRTKSFNEDLGQVMQPPEMRGGKCRFIMNNIIVPSSQRWELTSFKDKEDLFTIAPELIDSVWKLGSKRKTPQFSAKIPSGTFATENVANNVNLPAVALIKAWLVVMPPGTCFDPMNVNPVKFPFIEQCPLRELTYSHRLGKYLNSKSNGGWIPVNIPQMKITQQGFDSSLFREFFKKEVTF